MQPCKEKGRGLPTAKWRGGKMTKKKTIQQLYVSKLSNGNICICNVNQVLLFCVYHVLEVTTQYSLLLLL